MEFANRPNSQAMTSSDRLKKAIERNRAKMAKRQPFVAPSTNKNINLRSSEVSSNTSSSGLSLSERLARLKEKRQNGIIGERPSINRMNTVSINRTASPLSNSIRSNPTQASNIEMLKARRQNLTANNLQPNEVKNENKISEFGEKLIEKNFTFFERFFSTAFKALVARTLRVAAWGVCVFFLGIVIFGERGIVDYTIRYSNLEKKNNQLNFLIKENEEIKFQIYRLENDRTYQRQVIRDYLGYIANDEYLIIFAENN